ncbi:MAG: VCBS repeat-containing protein [Runella sp.]
MMIALLTIFTSCQSEKKQFQLLDSDDTGVKFNNFVEEDTDNNVLKYGYFYNGGGVAAGDFNNDGLVDLYFTGNMVADKLYLNTTQLSSSDQQAKITFEDATEAAGIKHNGWKTGVSLIDINNDGRLDIYVCRSGAEDPNLRRNLLYINITPSPSEGIRFKESAKEYGLDDDSYTTQAAFFDYDKDGDLDCFLLNHSVQEFAGFSPLIANFRQQADQRYGCKLLRNDNQKFVDVSAQAGLLNNVLSFGLGLNVSDFNNDGWLDLYVANDYNENDYLYLNQQNGTFSEVVRQSMGHTSFYSMGTDAADINNDGLTDIVTLDMLPEPNDRIKLTAGDDNYDKYQRLLQAGFHHQTMRNMLHLNTSLPAPFLLKERGGPNSLRDGVRFSEIGQLAGISNTDWSWAALLADFDNDGLKDLFITNGYARDYTNMEFLKYSTDIQIEGQQGKAMPTQMEIIEKMPAINQPNYIFKNKNGLTFEKKVQEWGFDKPSQSNGAVYADLDNDGDLDLITNNINDKAFIYQNQTQNTKKPQNWISIKLKTPNESLKIGAKVWLWADGQTQLQEFQPTRGFQSSMYVPLHFGIGQNTKIDSLTVQWTDGKTSAVKTPKVNQHFEINHQTAKIVAFNTALLSPFFSLQSTNEPSTASFSNDFKIQPLLPQMLSGERVAMAQGDINNDGREDVYIGGIRGQAAKLFLQTANGFSESKQIDFEKDAVFEDAAALFIDADTDGDLDLIVGSSGYNLNPQDPLLQPRLYHNQKGKFLRHSFISIPIKLNASTIAATDIDSDGDQDLFIGVHCVPRRYPEAQKSVLLQNDGKGQFSVIESFSHSSLVTGAAFCDLNSDQRLDLLIVSEWNKPKAYLNQKGKLVETPTITQSLNPSIIQSLIATDLDNDGDDDFVVGGLGLNHQFNITSDGRLRLYYGDFGDNGGVVPLLSMLQNEKEYPYASRDELLDQVPILKKKFTNYIDYSTATIDQILTQDLRKKAQTLEANEYRTGILWNDGGQLTFEPLPTEAQFAPVYAIAIVYADSDEKKDIILGGNMSRTRVRMGKVDANHGQVFCQTNRRKFAYVLPQKSGLQFESDVRAVRKVGRYLFVASQNGSLKSYLQ